MVESEVIPQQTRERIEQIGAADLVIGVHGSNPAPEPATAVATVREALASFSSPPRTLLVLSADPAAEAELAQLAQSESNSPVQFVSWPRLAQEASAAPVETLSDAWRAMLAICEKMNARAGAMIASDFRSVGSRWISLMLQPLIEESFDLVTPCYAHHKFEGLLNNSVISPLTRALYGKRIMNPMGPDFGFSNRLLQVLNSAESRNPAIRGTSLLASLTTEAVCGSLRICQAWVGMRIYPQPDWTNLSSVLAQVAGPLFLDMERNAPFWQRVRGSQPLPSFGDPVSVSEQTGAVDVRRMLESFQLGCRTLLEVWGAVLPPASLFELRKLAQLPADKFRMPDELWVRVVYDFALGHRLRTMNRDHLLRALTPLYLGWVASYALEVENAGTSAVERRLEALSFAYETGKPYLVSRWRWPDRFNP
jgi:hypothetical protein